MIFSALVDADFLDTEQYLDRQRSTQRSGFPPLATYLAKLDAYLDRLAEHAAQEGRTEHPVIRARVEVLNDCRRKATLPTGVFSLQVPTGGGKTLASLAFALRHAIANGCDRVIVAIPYTSIVEQTANVFAEVFGRENFVEHHSQADSPDRIETSRSRLACENWDAPLIVTTNVQLFESLFATRTSRCRKLHRVQRSVIVLDEAQTLPPEFLQPTLDALRWLVRFAGTTVVSCTATQPVLTDIIRFDPRRSLQGLAPGGAPPTEIVSNVEPLYEELERVRYRWPENLVASIELHDLAARVVERDCVLVVVNTRRDAEELVGKLRSLAPQADQLRCLSTNLCGQHRADVIDEIRECLRARAAGDGTALRVVSTQLVEAGVDLDFPRVFRALAGLDSIAQAAGRCNREGRLGPRGGEVDVFVRPVPAPLTSIARAVQATISVLSESRPESITPQMFQMYFERWYAQFSPDHAEIRRLLRRSPDYSLSFRTAAESYRLIDDADRVSVIIPPEAWRGRPLSSSQAHAAEETQRTSIAIGALREGHADRWHLRALQRRIVQVRREIALRWLESGELTEPCPGWFVLENPLRYDPMFGLRTSDLPYAPGDLVG
ncbi:MAG: CRISPR-associated helicase Cas3' [Hyphomonas sp.]|nr:CRISPR-associated helicase Cas3' [Hyphomonas sp.]